jgi:hypothetical protein
MTGLWWPPGFSRSDSTAEHSFSLVLELVTAQKLVGIGRIENRGSTPFWTAVLDCRYISRRKPEIRSRSKGIKE